MEYAFKILDEGTSADRQLATFQQTGNLHAVVDQLIARNRGRGSMTERRPLIGVTTQSLQAVEGIPAAFPASWVMNRMYLDALARAGAAPVLLPLLPEQPQVMRALYERLDGLLLPGGVDIEPSTFGEAPHPLLRRTDPPRDVVELQLARWALEDGMPVLGLCRGLQILNIAAGGTLFQDVQAQRFGSQKHDYEPPDHTRDFLAHDVAAGVGIAAARAGGRGLARR